MPYEGIGARHTAVASKAIVHGQIVVEDGFVGSAFKVEQIDRWVRPADAQRIDVGEEYELQIGGVHETAAVDALDTADVGDRVWIDPDDNRLKLTGVERDLPVGVVTEVGQRNGDETLFINSNAWQAFLPVPAA